MAQIKLHLLLVLLALVLAGISGMAEAETLVRVRIKTISSNLNVMGSELKIQRRKSAFVPAAFPATWSRQAARVEMDFSGKTPEWSVLHVDEKAKSERFLGRALAVRGQGLFINERRVPPQVLLFARAPRAVDVVAVIDLEKYLMGVLASEMPASWPLEALKAQAIASRTYALYQINANQRKPFHLESTVMDQVYNYSAQKRLPRYLREKIRRAVQETQGMVLRNKKGQVFQSYYHADCGGMAEEPHRVWKNGVFFGASKDSFCPAGPHAHWKRKVPGKLLLQKLGIRGAQFLGLEVVEENSSHRVQKMLLEYKKGDTKYHRLISGQELRKATGFVKIKSTMFKVAVKDGKVHFRGRGFGHGAGMCQWGAKRRSVRGQDYVQILNHYYPRARLVPRSHVVAGL